MKRTIASLALLRMNWDSYGRDYVEIFVPLIVTLISKKKYQAFTDEILRKDFESEYGLLIPYYPMITILRRTKKRGYIAKKSEKEYIPVKNLVEAEEFTENALALERKYNNVAKRFLEFCKTQYGVDVTDESADRILIAFLKEHDLDIVFASSREKTLLPDVETTEQEKFLVNKFIEDTHFSEPETFSFIVDISMGHILANAILYDIDIEKFQGKITSSCYLDTGIVFDILGVNEEPRQIASKELIDTLKKSGAKIFVFRHTYEEVQGILNGCIEWVKSPYYDPSKASRAARYFRDHNFTPSEVESFILAIDDKVNDQNILIVDAPSPNDESLRPFYIDEQKLLREIVNAYKYHNPAFDETEKEVTLYHDVKSLSAVNILRRNDRPLSLARVKHIFITTNATLANANRRFEMEEGEDGEPTKTFFFIPAAITDVFIGTLLWAQFPGSFKEINQKRLIANCYAALQPTKTLLRKFTVAAEKELEKGNITQDEYIVLRSSRMARNYLVEDTLNDADMFTDTSIPDILTNIKNKLKEELQQEADQKEKVTISAREIELIEKENDLKRANQLKEEAEKRVADANKKFGDLELIRSKENTRNSIILAVLSSVICIGLFEWGIYTIPWNWLINNNNSYGIQGCIDVIFLGLSFIIFIPSWRIQTLIVLILPFLGIAFQIIGGPKKP